MGGEGEEEIQVPSSGSVPLGKRRRPRKSGVSSKAVESGSQASDDIEVSSLFSHLRIGMTERLGLPRNILNMCRMVLSHLRREVKHLRSQNEELQTRIEALHEADDVSIQPKSGKRGGESLENLKSKVKKLTDEVSRLQFVRFVLSKCFGPTELIRVSQARERDRKKIRKVSVVCKINIASSID